LKKDIPYNGQNKKGKHPPKTTTNNGQRHTQQKSKD